jgi:hypothetical protein
MSTARVFEYMNEPIQDENTAISELWLAYVAVRQESPDLDSGPDALNEDL